LDYPRIVAADANHTSYHLQCALQLTTEIIADTTALLTGQDLPELSQRIVVTNLLGHPGKEEGELSAMAQAFRAAAQQGRQASQ
jgi:hypothetical protein